MERRLMLQLGVVFLIAQFIGITVAANLIENDVQATLITDNPDDIENALGLFVYIMAFTAMILIVIKYVKGWLVFKGIETLAVFATAIIVFSAFIPQQAFLFAVLIVALRWVLPENILLRNISSIIAVAGAGALIGVSLGVVPVLIFVVLLSVYDLIAVFGTKHMVKMGKAITKKNLAFTIAFPTKEHQFELGTGDLVIPLMFAVSVMAGAAQSFPYPIFMIPSLMVLLGSLAGLLITLDYSSKHVGRALPALPLQAVFMIIMLGLSMLIGF